MHQRPGVSSSPWMGRLDGTSWDPFPALAPPPSGPWASLWTFPIHPAGEGRLGMAVGQAAGASLTLHWAGLSAGCLEKGDDWINTQLVPPLSSKGFGANTVSSGPHSQVPQDTLQLPGETACLMAQDSVGERAHPCPQCAPSLVGSLTPG